MQPVFQRRQAGHRRVERTRGGSMESVTAAEFDRGFAVHRRGQFFVAPHADRSLVEGGRLDWMSSVSGQARTVANHAVYLSRPLSRPPPPQDECTPQPPGLGASPSTPSRPAASRRDMYTEAARKQPPGAEEKHGSAERVHADIANMSPLGRPGGFFLMWRLSEFQCSVG
ncbi:MAG: hypothetical protein M1826_006795 [Phylliscum demangeonii]|nr:MAG: hypothetical protein M1826_006795 [Phylliscum demangeonii]